MRKGGKGKGPDAGEIERLQLRIAELEEQLENAEDLYAELMGRFESEIGRRRSRLVEITQRELKLHRIDLQLKQERLIQELINHRIFYDRLRRAKFGKLPGSRYVDLLCDEQAATNITLPFNNEWSIAGPCSADAERQDSDSLTIRFRRETDCEYLWLRIRATVPALLEAFFSRDDNHQPEPFEYMPVDHDSIADYFIPLPASSCDGLKLRSDNPAYGVELFKAVLITVPGEPIPTMRRRIIRLSSWLSPESDEIISDNLRNQPFTNEHIPVTLFSDDGAVLDLHDGQMPMCEKLLTLRIKAENGRSFFIHWDQEEKRSDKLIEDLRTEVDFKGSDRYFDYCVPMPFSRLNGIGLAFPNTTGRIKLERAELWQFPGHGLSDEPMTTLPIVVSGDALLSWISPWESEQSLSFMEDDWILTQPYTFHPEKSGVRRLISPPLDIKGEALMAGVTLSHQYDTRIKLSADYGDGFAPAAEPEAVIPPGINKEVALWLDGGNLRQLRWEFDMGVSDAPLKIQRFLIVRSLARGQRFNFIPRCMHWKLFEPLLKQLLEEFDDAEFVSTETNSDNYELYPDNVAVIPYTATGYVASDLAAHLKHKLDISGCVRMIIPVMNPKGKGYEEFFSFARDANIPEVLIAESNGKIRKAPR